MTRLYIKYGKNKCFKINHEFVCLNTQLIKYVIACHKFQTCSKYVTSYYVKSLKYVKNKYLKIDHEFASLN